MKTANKEFWKDRKVFITGHTGFKGTWLSIILNSWGADVYGYALEPPTNPSIFELSKIGSRIKSTISDIRDRTALKKALAASGAEIVIHMAAQPLVINSYKFAVDTFEINVMGTVNILETMRENESVKVLINVTTDKVYENKEWMWGYRETEPLGGHDPYSSSKACSELVTSSYRNSFFNISNPEFGDKAISTARAGNVIGGGDWAEDRLIPDCIRAVLNDSQIIVRNPASIRPWQHVFDPLNGYLMLAEKMYEDGNNYSGAWNFGPFETVTISVEELVKFFCIKWGQPDNYGIQSEGMLHEAGVIKLDCTKSFQQLKWRQLWGIEQSIESIIEWIKAYRDKKDIYEISLKQVGNFFKI